MSAERTVCILSARDTRALCALARGRRARASGLLCWLGFVRKVGGRAVLTRSGRVFVDAIE